MSDDSPEAMKARAQARRSRAWIKVFRPGEKEPEVDEETLAMTAGERIALACHLSQIGYAFHEAANPDRAPRRLPRHAWPTRLVRG